MNYENIIKEDLKTIKKTLMKKKYDIKIILIIISIIACTFALCTSETPNFIDKLVNCIGILIIMIIINIFIHIQQYIYKMIIYRHINPNKFNYEINEIVDKNYKSSEEIRRDFYMMNGEQLKEHITLPKYDLKIKDEKYFRKTYSYVYKKAEIGKKYLIVYSGHKKKCNIIKQNLIINLYDLDKLNQSTKQ